MRLEVAELTADWAPTRLFDGEVVLVSGARGGIGSEVARLLAAAGARVIVAGRAEPAGGLSGLQSVASEILAAGGEAMALELDVQSLASAHRAMGEIVDRFGRLDAVFNAAGNVRKASLIDCEDGDFEDILDVHVGGQANLVAAALLTMRKQRQGRLITVSSGAAIDGIGDLAAYSTAKYAILGLTRHLARRLAVDGITVNAISPTAQTSMSREPPPGDDSPIPGPFRRRATVDVAPLVCLLASTLADGVTGRLFFVSGGHVIEFAAPSPSKSIQFPQEATPADVGRSMDWVIARPSIGAIGTRPTRDFEFDGRDGLPDPDDGLFGGGESPTRAVLIAGASADLYSGLERTFAGIGIAGILRPATYESGTPLAGAITFPASISPTEDDVEDFTAAWLRARTALLSTFSDARAAARRLDSQHHGVLIVVLPPRDPEGGIPSSDIVSAGLLGLAKSAWRSLEPSGVSVHAIYGPASPADIPLFGALCASLIGRRRPWPTGGLFAADDGHVISLRHETPLWQHFGEARLTLPWIAAILRASQRGS